MTAPFARKLCIGEKEHRLAFYDGNPSEGEVPAPEGETEETDEQEQGENGVPKKKETAEEKKRREDNREERRKKEEADRENEDPNKIIEKINGKKEPKEENANEKKEGAEQELLQRAEQFVLEAKNTLSSNEEKLVYLAGVEQLTPNEKLAYFKFFLAMDKSFDKESNSTLPDTTIAEINKKVFAESVVFSSYTYNLPELSPDLKQHLDAIRADMELQLSPVDIILRKLAKEKMKIATKVFLENPKNAELKKIIDAKQKADEADLAEFIGEEKTGKFKEFWRTDSERQEMIVKELPSIIEYADQKEGIRFALVENENKELPETEAVSLRITPKDAKQYDQILTVAKKYLPLPDVVKEEKKATKSSLLITKETPEKIKILIAKIIGDQRRNKNEG